MTDTTHAAHRDESARLAAVTTEDQRREALLTAETLQKAIFKSANFSSIATDAKGVIQIFNVGAERMLGYTAAEVVNKITPADISDPQEVIARAKSLSAELKTTITPGFAALVFKASRGIEDIYELTYIRKNGSRFPAVVSVTALRDAAEVIIGYLLIGTDNTARQQVEDERTKLDQRLHDQQFYTRSLIESNIDAIMTTDPQGIITDVNKQMETLTSRTRDELIGAPFKNNFTDPFQAEAAIRQVLSEGRITDYELTALSRDARETPVSYNATIFYDRERRPQGVFAAARDITERKLADARLQLAASVFTHAREGIVITDAAGSIVEVNETFSRITGYSHAEALGQNPRVFKSGRHPPDFYEAMWQALAGKGHWYGELWNRRKTGEVYAVMITISAVRDAFGVIQNYVGLFSDITLMKEHERQLEHIAHYDALTNLPNRVLLADRLQQAIRQSQRRGTSVAVVFLDLDGFKSVNDTHGHDVGDELLIALSQRMKAALRDGDTLARIGGDEFVAVLVDLDNTHELEPVLERMLQAASESVATRGQVVQVSASIGVTLYPQDGGDADLLMRHADQAMYAAKQAGRNRFHLFDVAEDVAMQTRHESLAHIHLALERAEFVLFYQPKVNMRTGAVVGAEALIRWQHPQRGLLLPAEFLPLIEDHPVSVNLGEWVIATALAQMAEWQASGLRLPVSVNMGARQLQQDNFVSRLGVLLAVHPELAANSLEIELLETSAREDMAKVSLVMHACRAMGVRFALDDFGTSYSSITYLKRLPAEVIKIDQSFVRDMLDDFDDLAIVKGIIGLAQAFHREVIAEGVETPAHGQRLLQLGCELAQGFGIARPMPASDMVAWIAAWPGQHAVGASASASESA